MSTYKIVTEPATEPVTVPEAKEYLRITGDADDPLLGSLITSARRKAEAYTQRAFITQTWDCAHDGPFSLSHFHLPFPPLQSVTSIKSYSPSDAESTLSSSAYDVDKISAPARVYLKDTYSWPTDVRQYNSMIVRFVAGYGLMPGDVPEDIGLAIKLMVSDWFENRSSTQDINTISEKLLWHHRIMQI